MNQKLLDELLLLQQRDVDMRAHLLSEERLYGDYASEMQQVHRENAGELDKLVSQGGWPGISSVGLQGSRAAWLIAQHAICTPELQRRFLPLLVTVLDPSARPDFTALVERHNGAWGGRDFVATRWRLPPGVTCGVSR